MYKMGIIGDKDSILGFTALGVSIYPVTNENEAKKLLHRLADEEYAVIFITEQIAEKLISVIKHYNSRKMPIIVPVPGNRGTEGIGMQQVSKAVEKAVGADILFNE